MQSRISEIKTLDAEVVAISADSVDECRKMAESAGIDFMLLSDSPADVIRAYGLVHEGASIDGRDIARPAVFIIDRDGRVAWRSLPENWRVRVRPETILEELRRIP